MNNKTNDNKKKDKKKFLFAWKYTAIACSTITFPALMGLILSLSTNLSDVIEVAFAVVGVILLIILNINWWLHDRKLKNEKVRSSIQAKEDKKSHLIWQLIYGLSGATNLILSLIVFLISRY